MNKEYGKNVRETKTFIIRISIAQADRYFITDKLFLTLELKHYLNVSLS